jgi:hypothetical protein
VGKKDLQEIIINKTDVWGKRIQILLNRPAQTTLLILYFKNLVLLKHKRVNDIGTRAQTRQRINSITSVMGDDALSTLEVYLYAINHLGKIIGIQDQSKLQNAQIYYQSRIQESSIQIVLILGAIFLFRNARSSEDVHQLQEFIEHRLIKAIARKLVTTTDAYDRKSLQEKINSYKQLIKAVEINFE